MHKRIHLQISLVGGQPTPVYQGIIHMQPDQVMLVCSKNSRKVADDIRNQLPSYSNRDIFIYEMSDTDLSMMYDTAEMIANSIPKGITLSLNISGGMKLWSVIFNNIFRRKRRSCHTFCIGQNGSFFDLKEKQTKGKVQFDMDTQFKILGHSLDEYTPLSEYTSADDNLLNCLLKWELLPKNYNRFNKLTSLFVDKYKCLYQNTLLRHSFRADNGKDYLSWDAAKQEFECFISEQQHMYSSEHASQIILNTGWFEYYSARNLANIFPEEHIRLNCVFRNVKNLPKNEIDIIVNTRSKLIFVECKTQVFNTTDIDKFNSAVKNYGGLGSKALFMTNAQMKPEAKEKCNDYNITTFFFASLSTVLCDKKTKELSNVIDTLNNTWNVK